MQRARLKARRGAVRPRPPAVCRQRQFLCPGRASAFRLHEKGPGRARADGVDGLDVPELRCRPGLGDDRGTRCWMGRSALWRGKTDASGDQSREASARKVDTTQQEPGPIPLEAQPGTSRFRGAG